ncbi:MAG: amidohydrolase [Theionarchaea archaeon]|nr:amidohydrolase [Theionarchaea archaeon]
MDLTIYNGTILTMTGEEARAVAVDKGWIRELNKVPSQEEIDLEGRVMIPGFIDCHTHFIGMGLKLLNVDLSSVTCAEQAISLLEKRAQTLEPSQWVLGYGWDESFWSEKRYLTSEELSHIENPVCAVRVDGHVAVLNMAAQQTLNSEKEYLYEDELFSIQSLINRKDVDKAFTEAMQVCHREGVTSIHDNPGDIRDFIYYQAMPHNPVRIYVNLPVSTLDAVSAVGLRTGFGNEWLRFGGIKIFTDGSIGAKTAATSFTYKNETTNGLLVYEDTQLRKILSQAHPNQTAVHAIGDRAIEQVISQSLPGRRNRIEHAELLRDDQIPRVKSLGLVLSMQPNFLQWSHPGGLYDHRFGTGRDNRFNTLRKAGIPLVFGSDCMPFSPLFGISQIANAPYKEQRLSVEEAFAIYTKNGAYASFEEHIKGTIEKGKLADFVVLSGDPREQDISALSVEMTIVGGEVVYRA